MVVVDTGASYISGPTSSLRLLMDTLGAKELSTNEVSWESGGTRGCWEHNLGPRITSEAVGSKWGHSGASLLSSRSSSRGAQSQARGCVCGGTSHTQQVPFTFPSVCRELQPGANAPRHLLPPWRKSLHPHQLRLCVTGEGPRCPSVTGRTGGQGPRKGTRSSAPSVVLKLSYKLESPGNLTNPTKGAPGWCSPLSVGLLVSVWGHDLRVMTSGS